MSLGPTLVLSTASRASRPRDFRGHCGRRGHHDCCDFRGDRGHGGLGDPRGHVGERGQGRSRRPLATCALLLILILPGCATLQEMMALTRVDFSLERVSSLRLAGIDFDRIQRYEDLGVSDVLRIGNALSSRRLPLEATLHVRADNPAENPQARLLELDWTLFLQDRETIGGGLAQEVVLPTGEVTDVPLSVSLDLLEFYDGGARELINLVLNLTGAGGEPVGVRLEAMPTVQTPIGPIRYPQPVVMGAEVANR